VATLTPSRARKARKTDLHPLQAPALKRIPWLVHGFSTRLGGHSSTYGKGTLNLGFTWRPTVKRMVEKGLGLMRYEFGTRPQDVYAAIGPGIQSCCYEVGEELEEEFESQFVYANELFHPVQESDAVRERYPMLFMNMRAPGHGDPCIKLHLDLREANRRQLLSLGVPEKNISAMKACTACNTRRFFSHRAEMGKTGRMLAVVGIKP
jgi:copper oxidase (laccase) domain-containing protein